MSAPPAVFRLHPADDDDHQDVQIPEEKDLEPVRAREDLYKPYVRQNGIGLDGSPTIVEDPEAGSRSRLKLPAGEFFVRHEITQHRNGFLYHLEPNKPLMWSLRLTLFALSDLSTTGARRSHEYHLTSIGAAEGRTTEDGTLVVQHTRAELFHGNQLKIDIECAPRPETDPWVLLVHWVPKDQPLYHMAIPQAWLILLTSRRSLANTMSEVKTTLANRKPRLSMKEIIRMVDPIEDFESNLPRSAEEKATNRDHPGCVVQARSSHGHLGV